MRIFRDRRVARPRLTGDVFQTWPGKAWLEKPGPWCRTKDRLGRRGAMLLTLGLTYVMVGYGEVVRDPLVVPGAWHLLAPDWVRATAWIISGLVASFFAVVRPYRDREPQHWWQEDTAGWLALYVVPAVIIFSFLTSYVLWVATDHARVPPAGDSLAWYNAVRQTPFIVVVLICSGWVENPRKCR